MIEFSVYDLVTGEILRTGDCSPDLVSFQALPGEGVLSGYFDPLTHYIVAGVPTPRPTLPALTVTGQGWSFASALPVAVTVDVDGLVSGVALTGQIASLIRPMAAQVTIAPAWPYQEITFALSGEAATPLAGAQIIGPAPTSADVRAEGQRRLEMVGAFYKPGERETFTTQEAEAMAWTADNAAPTPMLDAMLSRSGQTKADLVARVLANAAALKVATGAIIGAQQAILAMDPIPADFAADSRWP